MHGRVVAVLLVCGTVAVATQQLEPTTAQIPLRIVATDARGREVKGLTPADVQITEGTREQKIESLVRTAGPRKIGILLDEYHVSEGESAQRASAALLHFADTSLRPDDVVVVMKPLDVAATLAPVKSRDELRAALTAFSGRKGNYTPRTPFESEYMSVTPPAASRQRAQVMRAALQALIMAMNRSEPKGDAAASALLLVSEGFASEDRGRDRLATLRTVARAARMSNVTVYVLDPSPQVPSASPFNEQWRALVTQTGGLINSGQPLDAALARFAADLDNQYVATIAPSFKEDGAYHPLDVKVTRKDIVVRAPAGYWTPIAAERYTAPERPAMSTYLKTPHISGLIQPWFRMAKAPGGRTQVTFSWAPKGNRKAANLTFSAVTFEGVRLLDSDVPPQGSDTATRATFESVPGPIQVAMEIRDPSGKLLDTEVRYMDVPKLDGRSTLITAVEVLRTRTLREFLERQTQPEVMPAETRDFDRRDRLIVRVRAQTGTEATPTVSARLLNTRGQPMRELPALPPVDGISQFDLQLAPFARGDYHIEIKATTGSSSVSQLVRFRLVG